ncbi:class I SAM-dependent methyltransferase [Thermodesulfobacteriota bacterium]
MRNQLDKSKIGEIKFRKKLYQQQVERETHFDDEFDARGIEEILKNRMNKTLEQMKSLIKRKILVSPYIEIGAERCQRSLVLESDLGLTGTAVDISYDMLKSCEYYKEVFNKNKVPMRICCDAYNLPFLDNSIPFIFCYETLHHFPDPTPIINEIYRVLFPGGYFFFDKEPFKKHLYFPLYKGKKEYSKKYMNRSKARKLIDFVFCEKTCNESEYNIIENFSIPLDTWKEALLPFKIKHVKTRSLKRINTKLFESGNYLKYILSNLFGGEISGICRKNDSIKQNSNICTSVEDTLICPSCSEKGYKVKVKKGKYYLCNECGRKYPIIDDIIFLFSYNTFKKLYPEIFMTHFKNDVKR